MKSLPLSELCFREILKKIFAPFLLLRRFSVILFMTCAFGCTKNIIPDPTTGSKPLSFEVQVDVHIIGSSDVYQDDYHDSASFRIDVKDMDVTMSDIVNQRPVDTPSFGGIPGGTTAKWIPDSVGVTNITGVQLGLAYDSADKKIINILFDSEHTVSPGWIVNYPVTGTITVDPTATPNFPGSLSFVGLDEIQIIKPLEGTGSIVQVVYTITPIH